MNTLFGEKVQYKDYEYELALDFGIFESKKEALKDQFDRYIALEELLNQHTGSVWRELLQPHRKDLGNGNLLHSIWNLDTATVRLWFDIICRKDPKRRTIVLYGNSNTGKSLLVKALTYPVAPGYIVRDSGANVHWLENIHRKNILVWEEPSIHLTIIEDVKLLLGGEEIPINRKNKPIITRPSGPSVIISTNKQFWYQDPQPLLNRIFISEFTTNVSQLTSDYIEIGEIIDYLCQVYDGTRFDN